MYHDKPQKSLQTGIMYILLITTQSVSHMYIRYPSSLQISFGGKQTDNFFSKYDLANRLIAILITTRVALMPAALAKYRVI